MRSMLADVICETFQNEVGRGQVPFFSAAKPDHAPKAMLIEFRAPVDYDKEAGYRFVELMVFAPHNYVAVLARDRWTVIDRDLLLFDERRDEEYIKPGHDYVSGATEWRLLGYHDSGWRDAIRRFLDENERRLLGFGPFRWYSVIEMDEEKLAEIDPIIHARR